MGPLLFFLTGVATALAGVFIRSCSSSPLSELLMNRCGDTTPHELLATAHGHCAGCVMLAAGGIVVALSPLLALRRAMARKI